MNGINENKYDQLYSNIAKTINDYIDANGYFDNLVSIENQKKCTYKNGVSLNIKISKHEKLKGDSMSSDKDIAYRNFIKLFQLG